MTITNFKNLLYIFLVPSTLIALYATVNYWGPYRYISELQLEKSGGYNVIISIIFTVTITYIPGIFISLFVAKKNYFGLNELISEKLVKIKNSLQCQGVFRFLVNTFPRGKTTIGLAIFGLLLAVSNGYKYLKESRMPYKTFTTSELLAQSALEPMFLEITDPVILSWHLDFKSYNIKSLYFPVVDKTYKQGDKIKIFLHVGEPVNGKLDIPQSTLQGMIEYVGLPGPLREYAETNKILAPDHFMIYQETREKSLDTDYFFIMSGIFLLVIAYVFEGLSRVIIAVKKRL